jgi:hypothetical protein
MSNRCVRNPASEKPDDLAGVMCLVIRIRPEVAAEAQRRPVDKLNAALRGERLSNQVDRGLPDDRRLAGHTWERGRMLTRLRIAMTAVFAGGVPSLNAQL